MPFEDICQQIKDNDTKLTSINLRNSISADEVLPLAYALKTNKTLTSIDLSDNNLGDDGAQFLARVLETNKTLTTIDLSDNNIGDEGAQFLARVLETNKTLTSIDLAGNQISGERETQINALTERNQNIKSLKKNIKILSNELKNKSINEPLIKEQLGKAQETLEALKTYPEIHKKQAKKFHSFLLAYHISQKDLVSAVRHYKNHQAFISAKTACHLGLLLYQDNSINKGPLMTKAVAALLIRNHQPDTIFKLTEAERGISLSALIQLIKKYVLTNSTLSNDDKVEWNTTLENLSTYSPQSLLDVCQKEPLMALFPEDDDYNKVLNDYCEEHILIMIRAHVKDAIDNYQSFQTELHNSPLFFGKTPLNSQRDEIGFFTRFRHGKEGIDKADSLMSDINNASSLQEAKTTINQFLSNTSTRYHRHSLVSFVLDKLTEIPNGPWKDIASDESKQYDETEVKNNFSL